MAASTPAMPRGNPQQILATVWQRNLPLVRQRVHLLLSTVGKLQAGQLTPEARLEASEIAHKLAGSLGMFGYPKGSEIARNLEHLLETEAPLPASHFQELTEQLAQTLKLDS